MHVYPIGALIAASAAWGTVSGLALPRAAYRLAVEPGEPWRAAAADGTPYPAGARGWVGRGHGLTPGWAQGWKPGWVCAAVCAALAAAAGARPELAVWLLLAPVAVLMGVVDLAVLRLPDVLTLPAAAATAALLGAAALLPGHGGSWSRALLGGLALLLTYLLLHLVNPSGMGFGDVKLAPTLGMALAWYGWDALVLGTLLAFLLGALVAGALLALRRAERRTAMPFGPFMLVGALGGLLLSAG